MNVSDRIQSLRKAKGMSQEQVGESLGVSRQAVSKWESGQLIPDIGNIIQMSGIFGVTTDYLLTGKQQDAASRSANGGPAAVQVPAVFAFQYEYVSKRSLWGLPLLHVNLGIGLRRAKGIIAIGNIATGVVALGGVATGALSIGALSLGILASGGVAAGGIAVGGLAVGLMALGGLAIGIVALGGLSIGVYAAGGASFAAKVGVGDFARAKLAIGNTPEGETTVQLAQVSAEMGKNLIMEHFPKTPKWLARLMAAYI